MFSFVRRNGTLSLIWGSFAPEYLQHFLSEVSNIGVLLNADVIFTSAKRYVLHKQVFMYVQHGRTHWVRTPCEQQLYTKSRTFLKPRVNHLYHSFVSLKYWQSQDLSICKFHSCISILVIFAKVSRCHLWRLSIRVPLGLIFFTSSWACEKRWNNMNPSEESTISLTCF